jgi:hypothetical protein
MSSFDHGLLAGAFFARAAAFAMFGSPQWIQRIYRDSRVLHPPQHSQSRIITSTLEDHQSDQVSQSDAAHRKDWLFVRKEAWVSSSGAAQKRE